MVPAGVPEAITLNFFRFGVPLYYAEDSLSEFVLISLNIYRYSFIVDGNNDTRD